MIETRMRLEEAKCFGKYQVHDNSPLARSKRPPFLKLQIGFLDRKKCPSFKNSYEQQI